MSAADLTAGTVMDGSASLLNDTAKQKYTYAAQIPYLKIALQELREHFELHNVAVTDTTSAVIPVDAGQTQIVYNGLAPTPSLPNDFVSPLQLWERLRNIDPFTPMHRREFLPQFQQGVQRNSFDIYTWSSQVISFLPSIQNNDIKIDYVRELFPTIVNESSLINVVNAITFLQYRTAGLCAEFIERNTTSANAQNAYASLAIDRAAGIEVKGKQSIMTRRKPFRSGYKRRGIA